MPAGRKREDGLWGKVNRSTKFRDRGKAGTKNVGEKTVNGGIKDS